MSSSRRDFLKAAAAAGALAPFAGLGRMAFAADSSRGADILVVLFLRGGCDSLNLIGPANDRNYVADRIEPLRVLDQGGSAGIALKGGLDPAIDFRLHKAAAPLAELYGAGQLAIVHAVGLMNETRSHFVAQELIERGTADDSTAGSTTGGHAASPVESGWVARTARAIGLDTAGSGSIPAVSASNGVDLGLEGFAATLALPDLAGGAGIPGGDQARAVLADLYGASSLDVAQRGRLALAKFAAVDARLKRGPDGKVLPYAPDHGAAYDEGGDGSGRGLEAIARLIKMEAGLRLACADMGGWDTHENQPGRFNALAGQLGRNVMAFWNDLAAYHDRLTLVTISEFGRRLRSNKSNGTDHGHGGVMMALGGRVNGGRMYGKWPGLATPALDRGVDLAVTTDYRAVLASILPHRLARQQAADIFPGFGGADLGIIRAI